MIAALMELTNRLIRLRGTARRWTSRAWDETIRLLLLMLAPIAPHISEELWSRRLAAAGQGVVIDPRRDVAAFDETLIAEATDRAARSGQRQAARPGVRAGRSVRDRDRADRHGRDKIRAALEGQDVVRVIQVPVVSSTWSFDRRRDLESSKSRQMQNCPARSDHSRQSQDSSAPGA